MTDSSGVVSVNVFHPLCSSGHSFLSISIETKAHIPEFCREQKVFLKSRIDWSGIRNDLEDVNWGHIYRTTCPVESLNKKLSHITKRSDKRQFFTLLSVLYGLAVMINLGLMKTAKRLSEISSTLSIFGSELRIDLTGRSMFLTVILRVIFTTLQNFLIIDTSKMS